jgi:hypothetical protein
MTWNPASGKSPLGLPLPEHVGRQHIPTLDELAAEKDTTRAARGGDDVRHVCFECGGPTALIVVPGCRVCGGVGTLSTEQMDRMFPGA